MQKVIPKINPRFLKAAVYGANDGIVTTFAVMAGVVGAKLSPQIVIVLGLANLFADGLSMGLGDYLGERSERKLRAKRASKIEPCLDEATGPVWATGLVTFWSFIIAGFAPIVPFIFAAMFASSYNQFILSLITTGSALFLIGSSRTHFIGGKWYRNGLEMFMVGMLAAGTAYLIGVLTKGLLGQSL